MAMLITKQQIEEVFEKHNMRIVGYSSKKDSFGDSIIYVHPHFMDLYNNQDADIEGDIEKLDNVRVAYSAKSNAFKIKSK